MADLDAIAPQLLPFWAALSPYLSSGSCILLLPSTSPQSSPCSPSCSLSHALLEPLKLNHNTHWCLDYGSLAHGRNSGGSSFSVCASLFQISTGDRIAGSGSQNGSLLHRILLQEEESKVLSRAFAVSVHRVSTPAWAARQRGGCGLAKHQESLRRMRLALLASQ
ncbi:hypothetical protein L7F22_021588 [Adiantum nelumboides]|nr:hypothetical protein [Adiantum nelumboides]